jgi:uncharacterized membrane protein
MSSTLMHAERTEQPASESSVPADPGRALGMHRAISLVAAMGLSWPLVSAWSGIIAVPSAGIAVIALCGGGLWLTCAIATAADGATLERLDLALLALALLVLMAYSAAKLYASSGYGTDEAAFEQGAAQLLVHGHNPYGANLLGTLSAFSVPAKYATYTMSGGMVSTLGYPAFPVLVAAVFVQLTGGGQAVPIADVAALIVATVLVFRALPPGWRGLAVVVCVAYPILTSFALAGMSAIIMMAALVVVASRWTRVGETGALSRADRLSGVALGLALASNQLAWFIAPFLLTGLYLVRRGQLGPRAAVRLSAGYLGWAIGTFAAVNLPFLLWDPGAWLSGVLAPLTQHAIPYGQGIVGLTLFMRIGGGALEALTYAAGCVYVALLVLYAVHFRRLARACFVLPTVALFLSPRSLSGYWMMLIAVILVSVVTSDDAALRGAWQLGQGARRSWLRRPPRIAVAALFAPAVACLAVAFGTPQPLSMTVLSARSDTTFERVKEITVAVGNRTDGALRPHFATNAAGQATAFWAITSGPPVLAPHASASYRITAPDLEAMQPNGTSFLVVAVSDTPRTISSTVPFAQPGTVPGNW